MKKIILFLCLCVGVDSLLGGMLDAFYSQIRYGRIGKDNYISNEVNADVLILGSSRAFRHYVPSIIEDSLKLSCYNCGESGNGIIYEYAKLLTILDRYQPKLLIIDAYASFDLYKGDNVRYLSRLRPYYSYKGVDSVFLEIDDTERWKMYSKTYQYNSRLFNVMKDMFVKKEFTKDGYLSRNGILNPEKILKSKTSDSKNEIDTLKLRYFERMLQFQKKGIRIIVFVSPIYKKNGFQYAPIQALCKKYEVSFFDYSADSEISVNNNYFFDSVHMNGNGAELYTKRIMKDIRYVINK